MAKTDFSSLKRGDVIVRFGDVHKITKAEKITTKDDEKDVLLHFRPKYLNRRNETLKLSIPASSIDQTSIRLPVTKKDMKEEMKYLESGEYEKVSFNGLKVKRVVSDNDLHGLMEVLKTLWDEKMDERKNFTISKRNTFKKTLHRIQQEVAHVFDMKLPDAKDKITAALEKGWKAHLKTPKGKKKISEKK